jgi:NCS1 family nucleobase:cation symporter-1
MSAALIMALGAYIASSNPYLAHHLGIGIAGLFQRGRYAVALLIVAGLLQVNVMNLYSAYMSTVTIFTGVRSMSRVGLTFKFVVMFALMAVATAIAIATRDNFDLYFADVLGALFSILVPWSAINLADYYVVRKGQYSVDQVYKLDGIYGRYQWKSIGIYLLGVIIQIPFIRLSFYVGPLVRIIGADMAWLPGTIIPAIFYCLMYAPRADSLNTSLPARAPLRK